MEATSATIAAFVKEDMAVLTVRSLSGKVSSNLHCAVYIYIYSTDAFSEANKLINLLLQILVGCDW